MGYHMSYLRANGGVEDSTSKYTDWEACASFFVAIDILIHNDGIHHSWLEGEPVETVRGLLVLLGSMCFTLPTQFGGHRPQHRSF